MICPKCGSTKIFMDQSPDWQNERSVECWDCGKEWWVKEDIT